MDNRRVFTFLKERLAAGLKAVLVTVVGVEGSSMRGPGAHMGVCEDGSFVGSLSGGCIESAVVAEALEALEDCAPRVVRFGSGSPYIDIKLPCGGGLDIHFQPLLDAVLVDQCQQAIAGRRPFSLRLPLTADAPEVLNQFHPIVFSRSDPFAVIGHWPEPRLLIIGHGAAVSSLAKLSAHMNAAVDVLTSDDALLRELQADCVSAQLLSTPTEVGKITSDDWTAIVFLFHDHDWEIALMAHALTQPHFYLGAMGGRKAHAFRAEALKNLGCSDQQISEIQAPIGLFHSSRDADTLALSTLSQVIEAYHRQDFSGDRAAASA